MLQAEGQLTTPELGVVAGRKVGNAVKRNRAKRRLREAAIRVDLQPNTAYVLVASPDVLDIPFGELVGWLSAAIAVDGQLSKEDMW